MGPPFTLKAFTISALGGLGRIPGALIGGLVLGVTETFVSRFVPGIGTNLGVATSFVLLVVILILRPQGLLGGLRTNQGEDEWCPWYGAWGCKPMAGPSHSSGCCFWSCWPCTRIPEYPA